MPSHKGGECATEAKRREDGGNAVPRALVRLICHRLACKAD